MFQVRTTSAGSGFGLIDVALGIIPDADEVPVKLTMIPSTISVDRQSFATTAFLTAMYSIYECKLLALVGVRG
jgi:hypothetical protein